MKKKILLISSFICIASLFSSCEKRCHCYRFDGSHDFFTQEELNNMDISCSGLKYTMNGRLIYSLCEWDFKNY